MNKKKKKNNNLEIDIIVWINKNQKLIKMRA